jgi:hypothetical protein
MFFVLIKNNQIKTVYGQSYYFFRNYFNNNFDLNIVDFSPEKAIEELSNIGYFVLFFDNIHSVNTDLAYWNEKLNNLELSFSVIELIKEKQKEIL